MNELTQTMELDPSKLRGATTESAVLRELTGIINKDGVGEDDAPNGFSPPPADPIPTQERQLSASEARETAKPDILPPTRETVSGGKRFLPDKVFTTGRMKAGKDFLLKHFQYAVHGFADPLYALQEVFFPNTDKQSPGARKFLQTVGQWGRGIVNEQYPLSVERAVFELAIRGIADNLKTSEVLVSVDWTQFGKSDVIWVNALLNRINMANIEGIGIGVSNVRFENELTALTEAGWTHFHIMCSPETWHKRLRESGLTPSSPLVNDLSEKLAHALDADALQRCRVKPNGNKLRVIWNDPGVRPPSPRFFLPSELTR